MHLLIKRISYFFILITSFNVIGKNVNSSNEIFINGKHYQTLKICHSKKPQIIEFFSFLCPHCYQFDCIYHFNDILKKIIPINIKIIKYHVDFIGGKYGSILTHVWSVAIALNVEKKVLLPIFNYVKQQSSMIRQNDLKKIFIKASGISSIKYDAVWNSVKVKLMIKKQNQIVKLINLMSIPTLLVNNKYIINSTELNMSSLKNYIKDYINITKFLLNK